MSRYRFPVIIAVLIIFLFTSPVQAQTEADLVFRATTPDAVQVTLILEHPANTYIYEQMQAPAGVEFQTLENGYQIDWAGANTGTYRIGVIASGETTDPAVITLEILRDGSLIDVRTFNLWMGEDNANLSTFDFSADKAYRAIEAIPEAQGEQDAAQGLPERIFQNAGQDDQPPEQEQAPELPALQHEEIQEPEQPEQEVVETGPVTIPVTNNTDEDLCSVRIQSMDNTGPNDSLGDNYLSGSLQPGETRMIEIEAGSYFLTILPCDAFAIHGYQIWDIELKQGVSISIEPEDRFP